MSRTLWTKIGVGLLLLATGAALYRIVASRFLPLPVYMALPAATLIDQDGRAFALNQTRGKVVVLSLIYTHCPDICPLTTAKMKQMQDRIQAAGLSVQVQLVTFTVDPERDRPEVLKRFAAAFGADPRNWVFLTGASDQIQRLITGLNLYVKRVYYVNDAPVPAELVPRLPRDTPYFVNHTDRIFLIDRQGKVRAFLPGSRTNVEDAMPLLQRLVHEDEGGQ